MTSTLKRGLSMPFKLDHHHRITAKSFSVIRSVTTFNGTTSVHYSDVLARYMRRTGATGR